jgi:GT2 family glycosyltransferase
MIYFLTVNYYSSHLIANLINSLPSIQHIQYKLVIVNNSPEDLDLKHFENDFIYIIESKENIGFGSACNLGINYIFENTPQALIWLINPDALLVSQDLTRLKDLFSNHSEISILGTMIYTPDQKIWFAGGQFIPQTGRILDVNLLKNNDRDYVACDWVSGCSLILNLKNFREPPYFDPAYFLYYEDLDFCLRYAHQGHLVAITQNLNVIHHPSLITNKNMFIKIKHSTYSYLMTLEKYTSQLIRMILFVKLSLYAIILLLINRKVAYGKIAGIAVYFSRDQVKRKLKKQIR